MSNVERHALGARKWVTVTDFSSHLVLDTTRLPVVVHACTLASEKKKLDLNLDFSCSPAGLKILAGAIGRGMPLSLVLELPSLKKPIVVQDTAIRGLFRFNSLEVFAVGELRVSAHFSAIAAPPQRKNG